MDNKQIVGFYQSVVNPEIWRAIFSSLQNTEMRFREVVLQDVNTVLINK